MISASCLASANDKKVDEKKKIITRTEEEDEEEEDKEDATTTTTTKSPKAQSAVEKNVSFSIRRQTIGYQLPALVSV